jgi:serine/threonine protein kinase
MSEALSHTKLVDSLSICDYKIHPSGSFGCFRCIDDELLQKLLLMVSNKKVKIYPVVDISTTDDVLKSSTEINANLFFTFLYGQKICFKVFFADEEAKNTRYTEVNVGDFAYEFRNIEILKTMPSVKRKDIREESSSKSDEDPLKPQQNFLDKFTTYYQYQHPDGKDVAFVLEFTDSVKIVSRVSTRSINKIYIILNKFCNNELSNEQKLSRQFHDEIYEALMILTSHGYCHNDTKFDNIVDCGKDSIPRYKLIDFGNMRETHLKIGERNGYEYFLEQIDSLDLEEGGIGGRWRKVLEDAHATRKPKDYKINAATFAAPLIRVAYDAAKKGREFASASSSKKERDIAAAAARAAMKITHEKVEAIDRETKLEVVETHYPRLIRLLRYMRKNYMSNYMLSKCNISGVTVSYEKEEEKYPSATFQFESVNDFNECKKKLKLPRWIPWMFLEKSLIVKLNSQYIEEIYNTGYDYDVTSRKKMMDIDMEISSIGDFLRNISWFSLEKYKTELDKYFIFIIGTFKINGIPGISESDFAPLRFFHQQQQQLQQEGGQTRCKLKRSTCKKKKIKSKNKIRTKSKNKTRTK